MCPRPQANGRSSEGGRVPARVQRTARAGREVLAQAVHDAGGGRTLHGDEAGQHRAVGNLHPPAVVVVGQLPVKPEGNGWTVASVWDQQKLVVGQAIEDRVVDHAAPLVADETVPRPAHPQGRRRPGEERVQQPRRVGAADVQPAHVGDVKQSCRVADCLHLRDGSLVLHRHIPPAEGHHSGAQIDVGLVEGGAKVFAVGIGGHGMGIVQPANRINRVKYHTAKTVRAQRRMGTPHG